MRRRKLLVASAVLPKSRRARVALAVAAAAVVATEENFDRICEGMSRAEVEATLGPAGDFRTKSSIVPEPPTIYPPGLRIPVYDQWISDAHVASVAFDPAFGLVKAKWFDDNDPMEQSVFDNLLWRLKRQWHRWFPE
jgi:hypothetical protein